MLHWRDGDLLLLMVQGQLSLLGEVALVLVGVRDGDIVDGLVELWALCGEVWQV